MSIAAEAISHSQQTHQQRHQPQAAPPTGKDGVEHQTRPGEGASRSMGLPDYGSGGLAPGASIGGSSSLPSFDLDAEMNQLEQQGKVGACIAQL